jgi:hypothetical protein
LSVYGDLCELMKLRLGGEMCISSGPRHCGRDCEKRNDSEVFGTVLFVGDNQRRFPGRKANEISMWHFEHPPRSRFDLERLIFPNQLFNQGGVHSDAKVIATIIRVRNATVKTRLNGSESEGWLPASRNVRPRVRVPVWLGPKTSSPSWTSHKSKFVIARRNDPHTRARGFPNPKR